MELADPDAGELTAVYLFVGTLPFSRHSHVEPTPDTKRDTWPLCHVHMFEHFGGSVPAMVPDNLKTGVVKHPRGGEAVPNGAHEEMAARYGAAIIPGRVRKPKDKPGVENAAYSIALGIIGPPRDTAFTSFDAPRAAVAGQPEACNAAPFQKRSGSRKACFGGEEKPLLGPLPAVPHEICTWVYDRKVQKNGHVAHAKNFYSVSHIHVGKRVDLRIAGSTLEVFLGGKRLATHKPFPPHLANKHRTTEARMPRERSHRDWNAERIRKWALRVGPCCSAVIERGLASARFEEQACNPCLAILRLSHAYSAPRLERACEMVLETGVKTPRYARIKPILETNQDKIAPEDARADGDAVGYVRGAGYHGGI